MLTETMERPLQDSNVPGFKVSNITKTFGKFRPHKKIHSPDFLEGSASGRLQRDFFRAIFPYPPVANRRGDHPWRV
jgi:hypothetical protein